LPSSLSIIAAYKSIHNTATLLGFELVLKPKLWIFFLEVVNRFPNGIFLRISGPSALTAPVPAVDSSAKNRMRSW
jgi:hypothetical protein